MYDLVTKINLTIATENAIEFLEETGTNIDNNAPVDIQLLFKQIEFLQSSIRQFTSNISTIVIVLGFIFTAITFVANYLSNKNYQETLKIIAKKSEENLKEQTQKIEEKVISELSDYTEKKVLEIKKIIAQESTISQTKGYYVNADKNNPLEFRMLRKRGFEGIKFSSEINNQEFDNKIIILDLINLNNTDKAHSDKLIDDIEQGFPENSILIIYVPFADDRIKKLLGDKKIKYVTIANNRITLVGAVVDSAYILDTIL